MSEKKDKVDAVTGTVQPQQPEMPEGDTLNPGIMPGPPGGTPIVHPANTVPVPEEVPPGLEDAPPDADHVLDHDRTDRTDHVNDAADAKAKKAVDKTVKI